jgi:hypothetical protein
VTADWVVGVFIVVATAAVAVAVLVRARPADLGDVASGRVDPERVQRDALRRDREDLEREVFDQCATGEHDVLPEVDDLWREVALDYLERIWALPAEERAS